MAASLVRPNPFHGTLHDVCYMLKHTPCGMHGAFIAILQRTSGPSAPIPNIEYAARHGCAAYSPTVRPGAMSNSNCLPSQYLCPLSMQHATCGVQDATEMQQMQQACSPHPVPLSITDGCTALSSPTA
jgi:hypothetical protein